MSTARQAAWKLNGGKHILHEQIHCPSGSLVCCIGRLDKSAISFGKRAIVHCSTSRLDWGSAKFRYIASRFTAKWQLGKEGFSARLNAVFAEKVFGLEIYLGITLRQHLPTASQAAYELSKVAICFPWLTAGKAD